MSMQGNPHYTDAEAPGKYYLNRNLNTDADVAKKLNEADK